MGSNNKGVPRWMRKALIARDGLRCYWCRRPCHDSKDPLYKPQRKATADHLVPVIDGGDDDLENLVVACHYCNKLRAVFQNPSSTPTVAMLAACEFRGRTFMRPHLDRQPAVRVLGDEDPVDVPSKQHTMTGEPDAPGVGQSGRGAV